MLDMIRQDIRAVLERDPAARSSVEVLLCYSGLHAICLYRRWSPTLRVIAWSSGRTGCASTCP